MIILKFVANNRFLEIVQANAEELSQLNKITSGSKYNHHTGKTDYASYCQENRFISAGFWFKCLALNDCGYQLVISNINEFIDQTLTKNDFDKWIEEQNYTYVPYAYQSEGAYLACKFQQCKNLYDTGGGKSFIVEMICRFLLQKRLKKGLKVLVIVPRTMLVTQMPSDFKDYSEDGYILCDQVMAKDKSTYHENSNVVIGNISSLIKKPKSYFEQFGAVIVDEGHKSRTNSVQTVMNHLFSSVNLKYISALSGTFSEESGDYHDVVETAFCGPTLKEYYVEKLKEEYGSVADCEVACIEFNAPESLSYLYNNSLESNTASKRWGFETGFIQSMPEYKKLIIDIAIEQDYNQVLLFTTKAFLYEMAELAKRVIKERGLDHEVKIITGDVKSKDRDEIKDGMEYTNKQILFAMYPIMDTGVSIKNLGGIHLVDSTKSVIRIRQSIGRVLRLHPDKDKAQVFDYSVRFRKKKSWNGPWQNIYFRHMKERQKIYKKRKFKFTHAVVKLQSEEVNLPEDFDITPMQLPII